MKPDVPVHNPMPELTLTPSQRSMNSATDLLEAVQHGLVALRLRTEHCRAGDARRGGHWTERTGGARAGRRYHRRLGRFQVFILVVLGHLEHKEQCKKKKWKAAVMVIRDILVRIRIPGSVPLTNGFGSGVNSGSESFLQ
jgi:hypothetical protein